MRNSGLKYLGMDSRGTSNPPLSTQPYKGTRDFYPTEKRVQNYIFSILKDVSRSFGYLEYDGPMLENFELYAAKSGEELVNQQLYSFLDRGERKVAIRPEMTPTLARMVAAKLQELPQPIRWFSVPNLWRYERPQRGRLREHWQLNVDILGGDKLQADLEILQVAVEIFKRLGALKNFQIRMNHRGLMDTLFLETLRLDADTAQKLAKLLDAKAKLSPEKYEAVLQELGLGQSALQSLDRFLKSDLKAIAQNFPCEGAETLRKIQESMQTLGLGDQVLFDPAIMRGMDYYTGTVFEGYDISPENNRALFGGGRYDNLIGLFGKQKLSGMGFGMGDVSLINFCETHKLLPEWKSLVDVFVALPKEELRLAMLKLAATLRAEGLSVISALDCDGFGAHLKLASKHQAQFAILPGEEEWRAQKVVVKNLSSGEQETVPLAHLNEFLRLKKSR